MTSVSRAIAAVEAPSEPVRPALPAGAAAGGGGPAASGGPPGVATIVPLASITNHDVVYVLAVRFAGCAVVLVVVERGAIEGDLLRAVVAGDQRDFPADAGARGRGLTFRDRERRPRDGAAAVAVAHPRLVRQEDVERPAVVSGDDELTERVVAAELDGRWRRGRLVDGAAAVEHPPHVVDRLAVRVAGRPVVFVVVERRAIEGHLLRTVIAGDQRQLAGHAGARGWRLAIRDGERWPRDRAAAIADTDAWLVWREDIEREAVAADDDLAVVGVARDVDGVGHLGADDRGCDGEHECRDQDRGRSPPPRRNVHSVPPLDTRYGSAPGD